MSGRKTKDEPNSAVRVLVIDLDGCAMSISSKRPDLLSTALLKHVKKQKHLKKKYVVFGCVTNRTTMSAAWVKYSRHLRRCYTKHTPDELKNILTSKIIKNFKRATRLRCCGVSMLDDVTAKLGATYKDIKKYEETGDANWGSICTKLNLIPDLSSKNSRLLLIAKKIAKRHPNKKIIMDFMDDSRGLCDEAATADQQSGWPENVKLNVFQHRADEGEKAEIIPIYLHDKGYVGPKKSASSYKHLGLFAVAATTVAMATAGVAYSNSRVCSLG